MWVDILVLGHLMARPSHGYEIKQRVRRSIGGAVQLNNNALYPALRRLEEMGAVVSELVPREASPPRRVYRVTDRAIDLLRGMIEDLAPEQALDDLEYTTRVAFFDLVDPEARASVLRTRAAASRATLEHLRWSRAELVEDANRPYALRMVDHLIAHQEADVRFAEDLAAEEERRLDAGRPAGGDP